MAAPNLSGQTLNDRILAARHSLAGQGLAKAVCKATTEELIGPKKKHLDYLLHCTEEPNVSIPSLANLLIERTQSTNWIVVFKSLVTTHHLMCYGNERFVQYLASSNASFQLSSFLDKSGVQGYDMSPFIRRYAKYLTEKAVSYRTVAFDFCKVKRGKEGGTLRQMSAEKLLKTLPVLQSQVDALLDFEVSTSDLTNGVINSAFMLLFRDLIRLFACYNDGIINLLEKFFDMNKKNCRDALDSYKKFLIRMDRVAEFLKVAESVGVDKGDIPDLAKAPSSLLEALEAHLANLEGRKVGSPSSATTPTGGAAGGGGGGAALSDPAIQQQLLAEEEQAMAKYKEQHKATNPFMASLESAAAAAPTATEQTPNILDLFGMQDPSPAAAAASASAAPPSDKPAAAAGAATAGTGGSADLLQLSGNPFANIVNQSAAQPTAAAAPTGSAIDSSNGPGANFFGNILQPQGAGSGAAPDNLFGSSTSPFGGPQPMMATNGAGGAAGAAAPNGKMVTGDLDSSLANLTSNLNLTAGPGKGAASSSLSNQSSSMRGPPMMMAAQPMGFSQPPQPTNNAMLQPSLQQPLYPQLAPMMGSSQINNKF